VLGSPLAYWRSSRGDNPLVDQEPMDVVERDIMRSAARFWVAAALLLATGCQKETVGTPGSPLQEEGAPVSVTMTGYALQRVEVEGEKGPLIYDKPVLVLDLSFENKGATPFFYQPTHTTDKASDSQAPLLFVDPGPKGELKQNIPGVFLEQGLLDGQQSSGVQIQPGESAKDRYLFVPPEETNMDMVLTIPAALHGGKGVIKVKISYTKPDLPPAKTYKAGEAIKVGDAVLTVKSAKVEFVKLKDTNQGEGFSKDPVVKVSYQVENKGKEPLNYDPGHKQSGEALGPTLVQSGGNGRYMRVRFGADRDAVGQVGGRETLAAGKSLEDFAVFERPPQGVDKLLLKVPGRVLGQKGLVTVEVPYSSIDPPKPAELTPAPPPTEEKPK
jgi:hypothetical protein